MSTPRLGHAPLERVGDFYWIRHGERYWRNSVQAGRDLKDGTYWNRAPENARILALAMPAAGSWHSPVGGDGWQWLVALPGRRGRLAVHRVDHQPPEHQGRCLDVGRQRGDADPVPVASRGGHLARVGPGRLPQGGVTVEMYDELAEIAQASEDVILTHQERVRCFRWFRKQAIESILMAKQMQKLGVSTQLEKERILLYLGAAKEIFPLTRNGESVSMESIIQGQEPHEE